VSTNLFGSIYLRWFSKPKVDRPLYQAIQRNSIRSIVELGIDSTDRTLRLLRLARQLNAEAEIRYVAVDMFDARTKDLPSLTLKDAHKQFSAADAPVRLVPGDLTGGLARIANEVNAVDLMIVSARFSDAELEAAWRYVPRMLSPKALVYRTSPDDESAHTLLSARDLEELSNRSQRARRAA